MRRGRFEKGCERVKEGGGGEWWGCEGIVPVCACACGERREKLLGDDDVLGSELAMAASEMLSSSTGSLLEEGVFTKNCIF